MLPVTLPFDESITSDDLVNNQAQWRRTCDGKFSKCKLERAKRKRDYEEAGPSGDGTQKKRQKVRHSMTKNSCIFCSKSDSQLHEFMTMDADQNIRRMVTDLQDTAVLSRIAAGDVVAVDGMYHLNYLTEFRNRHHTFLRAERKRNDSDGSQTEKKKIEARAVIELTSYIETSVEEETFCFKFSELRHMYEERLAALEIQKEVNKMRFKEQILNFFPKAQEQNDGKHVVLFFYQGMKQMLKQAFTDYEGDASILAKAAKIIREDIFKSEGFHFDATFPPKCQEDSIPTTLKMLVSMMLKGPTLKNQEPQESQATLTICQTVMFNCTKTAKSVVKQRHSLTSEPPLPLYIGLNEHTLTRSKKWINRLHALGLSVSYSRILQLENQLASAVCQKAQREGVVCPSQLRIGLFTAGAMDNLDHNPSSTTAKGSFHGTGISLFQSTTSFNKGQKREVITLLPQSEEKDFSLPNNFSVVPAVSLKESEVEVPKKHLIQTIATNMDTAVEKEKLWLKTALDLVEKDKPDKGDCVAWLAYHASQQHESSFEERTPALSQLLPLFYEKAATAAMVKHGMDVVRRSTEFLNSGQIPVIAMDAPLFALAKYVQWTWPETHGEDKIVVMLGGLHVEMALWKTVGDYLDCSGWTNALTQAGIASSGTAESFLSCSHVTRTRHAHQVNAVVLRKL